MILRPSLSTVTVALVGALLGAAFGRSGEQPALVTAAFFAAAIFAGSYLVFLMEQLLEGSLLKIICRIVIGVLVGAALASFTSATMLNAISLIWAVFVIEAFVIEKVILRNAIGEALVSLLSGGGYPRSKDDPPKPR